MPDFALPYALPAAALAVVMLASIARGLALRARGVLAYGFSFRPEIQKAAERFWKLAVILVAAATFVACFAPEWEPALGRPDWSYTVLQRWIAGAILLIGAVFVLAGQHAMGASWRVGVPSDGPGALVTRGLFRMSRNPVFVGMFALAFGVFIWSPTLLSASALPLAAAMMAVQTRVEEEALAAKHGESYRAYAAKTPRWIWPLA
jgi:protein-S-isoprenylcysteine O-methyltransferase Ste14